MTTWNEHVERAVANRRTLHKRPEEGWTEFETTWFVVRRLRALGLEVRLGTGVINPDAVMGRDPRLVEEALRRARAHGVPEEFIEETQGFTGAVGILRTGRPGPVTALRFDMDCVLVTELQTPEHLPAREGFASERPGFMHACGHDAHTAVGLEAASWAVEHRNELCGTVKFLFQPAEEGVRGGAAMAASGIVDDVTLFLGAHVGTYCRQGEVGLCEGGFLASTKLDVHFRGLPSHAGSDPEKGRSALMAACAAAMMIQGIPRNGQGDTRVAVGRLNAGEGRNVTPVHADMQLEVRGATAETNQFMADWVCRIVEGIEKAYDVKGTVVKAGEASTLPVCPALLDRIEKIVSTVEGVQKVLRISRPSGSEDCTMLMRRVIEKGGEAAFVLYGANQNGHHRSDFDIEDVKSLPVGLGVFLAFIRDANGCAE